MLQGHHIDTATSAAQYTTYAGTSATVLLWGLHISDIAVILSAFASVSGVALQFYLAVHKLNRLERRQDTHIVVTKALAESHRVLDGKIEGDK